MRPRNAREFLYGFLFILLVSISLGYMQLELSPLFRKAHLEQPVFLPSTPVQSQLRHERLWKRLTLEKIASIGANEGLLRPARIRLGNDNSVFVLDFDEGAVKQFSFSSRKQVGIFRSPHSPRPTDFALGPEGNIWLSDPNALVSSLRADGTLEAFWPRRVRAIRLASLKDRILTLQVPVGGEHDKLFGLFSSSGEEIVRFGHLLDRQHDHGIVLVGTLAEDVEGASFLYAPQYGGVLTSLTEEGQLRFIVKTIDGPSLPQIEITDLGARKLPGDLPVTVHSLGVEQNRVYVVMERKPEWGPLESIVDFYAKRDGTYLYSVRAPEHWKSLLISGQDVYTASRSELTHWKGRLVL